jgi:hypothetical protein
VAFVFVSAFLHVHIVIILRPSRKAEDYTIWWRGHQFASYLLMLIDSFCLVVVCMILFWMIDLIKCFFPLVLTGDLGLLRVSTHQGFNAIWSTPLQVTSLCDEAPLAELYDRFDKMYFLFPAASSFLTRGHDPCPWRRVDPDNSGSCVNTISTTTTASCSRPRQKIVLLLPASLFFSV